MAEELKLKIMRAKAKWTPPKELLLKLKREVEATKGDPRSYMWVEVERTGWELLMKCVESHLGRTPTWSAETWREDTEATNHCIKDHNIPNLHEIEHAPDPHKSYVALEVLDDILLAWVGEKLKKEEYG